jgi:hypothetical protein
LSHNANTTIASAVPAAAAGVARREAGLRSALPVPRRLTVDSDTGQSRHTLTLLIRSPRIVQTEVAA